MLRMVLVSVLMLVASCGRDAAMSTVAEAEVSNKIYKWKLVTTWPKNLPGMGIAPETMADKVREMSNGRLDIKVYGAREIVPALEVFEAVSTSLRLSGCLGQSLV